MSFFCYCLEREDSGSNLNHASKPGKNQRQTYIGATVDPERRLRQHQGELKGGARATQGKVWKRVCLVGGFPTWNDALKFEWRWKRFGRKYRNWEKALEALLALDKPTESGTPFAEYPEGMPVLEFFKED